MATGISVLNKRKRDADGSGDGGEVDGNADERAAAPRKRERYTRIACTACKTRKVKCSGTAPCSRCIETKSACEYATRAELPPLREETVTRDETLTGSLVSRMEACLETLQQQVAQLSSVTPQAENADHCAAAVRDTRQRTISLNNLDTFQLCLSSLAQHGHIASNELEDNSSHGAATDRYALPALMAQAAKPVQALGYTVALHCVETLGKEVLPATPCVSVESLRATLDALFNNERPPLSHVTLDEMEILKAAIAVGAHADEAGEFEVPLANDLESNMTWSPEKVARYQRAEEADVIMACLLSLYYFQHEEGLKAWRMAGFAARTSMELGLHMPTPRLPSRSRTRLDDIKSQRRRLLFCSVYELDGRGSTTTCLPSIFHNLNIDEQHLEPGPEHEELSIMIRLNRLHAEAMALPSPDDSAELSIEAERRAALLDCQLHKLTDSNFLPGEKLQLPRVLAHLRIAVVRLMAYRHVLDSAERARRHPRYVRILLDGAHAIIRMYTESLSNGSRHRRILRPAYEGALALAVGFLFLAAAYNPVTYGPQCKDAFRAGLEALRSGSDCVRNVGREHWYSLQGLTRAADRIGLSPSSDGESPPSPMSHRAGHAPRDFASSTVGSAACFTPALSSLPIQEDQGWDLDPWVTENMPSALFGNFAHAAEE